MSWEYELSISKCGSVDLGLLAAILAHSVQPRVDDFHEFNLQLTVHYFTGTDTDECATGANNCSPYADCLNTVDSYTCTCRAGYIGNGTSCTGKPAILFVRWPLQIFSVVHQSSHCAEHCDNDGWLRKNNFYCIYRKHPKHSVNLVLHVTGSQWISNHWTQLNAPNSEQGTNSVSPYCRCQQVVWSMRALGRVRQMPLYYRPAFSWLGVFFGIMTISGRAGWVAPETHL